MFIIESTTKISIIHEKSFVANAYGSHPFRMIGLIDVSIEYTYGTELVTLAYYRSSGTNNGKIEGLWYPIVGIKMISGEFQEFSPYINDILTKTTHNGMAKRGWLAKSLFFFQPDQYKTSITGFSNGSYAHSLLLIGQTLRTLYEEGKYKTKADLVPSVLNHSLTAERIYPGNTKSQKENFEQFVHDIYHRL